MPSASFYRPDRKKWQKIWRIQRLRRIQSLERGSRSMAIAGQFAIEENRQTVPTTMLAAVYHGMNDVRLETVPVPEIGAGELLVRVHTCGVCGTDLKKIATGSHSAPRIFGHETTGVVAAVGDN